MNHVMIDVCICVCMDGLLLCICHVDVIESWLNNTTPEEGPKLWGLEL